MQDARNRTAIATLTQTWQALWQRLGGNPEDAIAVFQKLLAAYTEPHRAYHTLEHIQACLYQFDTVRSLAQYPDAVETALWFHDAIYDTRATDNEIRSAHWAFEAMSAGDISRRTAEHISDLVIATQHFSARLDVISMQPDAALLVDIDLSILGYPPSAFEQYERQIRQEYNWVPETAYRQKRTEILCAFLTRPWIYQTPYFQAKYEFQARQNLNSLIQKWSSLDFA